MFIYKITNMINGKVYIGQTIQPLKTRFWKHCCKSSNTLISKAIQKYGKKNFKVEVIDDTAIDAWDLSNLEIFYIKKYESMQPNGYNVSYGGESNNFWEYLSKERLEECKKNISNSLKSFYSKKEIREKMAIAKGSSYFEVFDIKTDKLIWSGFNKRECAKELNINPKSIYRYFKGTKHRKYRFKVNGEFVKIKVKKPSIGIFCTITQRGYYSAREYCRENKVHMGTFLDRKKANKLTHLIFN